MNKNFILKVTLLSCLITSIYFVSFSQQIDVNREALGKVVAAELNELSGMIASRMNVNHFFVHNDSGDKARFFLIDKKAQLKATYYLDGIDAIDIEDIAWLTIENEHYLILADIGDNRGARSEIKLYLINEPIFDGIKNEFHIPNGEIRTITLKYPDKARDAESIFVDPVDQSVYLISKRDFNSILFRVQPFKNLDKDYYLLEKMLTLPFNFITAADISVDGSRIVVKNLLNVFYYDRKVGQPIAEALAKSYKKVSYIPEPQGEAIAFDLNGKDFYTISERPFGLDAYLYWYKHH